MFKLPRTAGLALAVTILTTTSGCQSNSLPPPKTFPVTGTVVYKGGGPLKGGAVQFLLATSAAGAPSVVARIQDDGTFALETLVDNQKVSGAPEGEYRVNVMAAMNQDQSIEHVTSPANTFKVEPKSNSFTIEVEIVKGR